MAKKYRVNEIFHSIQGEGFYAGVPAVFIRFAGCNLKCAWCDTHHETFTEETAESIVKEIPRDTRLVVLTGGEPMMQVDDELIHALALCTHILAIETNGTYPISPKWPVWVTCSPKTDMTAGGLLFADEIKLAYPQSHLPPEKVWEQWKRSMRHSGSIEGRPCFWLQPIEGTVTTDTLAREIYFYKHGPAWGLSAQLHKLIGVK
jgi:organic radical activating enzyme